MLLNLGLGFRVCWGALDWAKWECWVLMMLVQYSLEPWKLDHSKEGFGSEPIIQVMCFKCVMSSAIWTHT
uniref:ASL1 fusion protein n=1 Tax=Mus musculus TaxID=10090 RepID=C6EQI2_MOUSE|nr:ASL1 fusion protein [Mus musculus]